MSILIIGGGEIGRFTAEKLIQEKKEVVIIEKSERVLDEIEESLDAKFILGNGAAPRVLREAGLSNADMVIAVTDSDEINLLATMFAGMEAPQAIRIARVRNPDFDIDVEKLQQDLRVSMMINPDREAARSILKVLKVPGASDILEFFDGQLELVGTAVRRHSPLINRPLREMVQLRQERQFLIAAIFRSGQLIIPTGDSRLMPGDQVYFVTREKLVSEAMQLLGHKGEKAGNVMIHGGGYIGMNLAQELEKSGTNVKVVEFDPRLCSILSRNLDKSVILNATATDQDFLEEENIGSMHAFIAVTKDDEDNILSALLAKRMGCPLVIALSHKRAYQPFISALGIDVVINPRQLTTSAILRFIRKGKVLHVSALADAAEIIEAEALDTSDLVGKAIHQLKLPKGVLVLSIKRGDETIVPWGETIIETGDRVVIMCRREVIPKVEKLITVRLEYF